MALRVDIPQTKNNSMCRKIKAINVEKNPNTDN